MKDFDLESHGGTSVAAVLMALPASSLAATPIKVGAAINLTGPASTWGQYHAKGTQDYLRYVNEVKGGVGGRTLELILVDTGYKVPEAVAAVKKFAIQDKVDMILTWGAGEGLAAKPLVQGYKIPTINYSTSWELLEKPVDYSTFLWELPTRLRRRPRVHQVDPQGQGTHRRVGLLTYNNAYGRSIHKTSQEYAKANRDQHRLHRGVPSKTVDLTTELLRLNKKNGAEYVFMQMLPATIVTAFKSADRIKYSPQFFGTWTSTDPDFFKLGKGLIRDRLKMQFPGGLPGDKGPGIDILRDLWKRYKTVTRFDAAYWEGVVVGMIVERAALRAHQKHGKVDRETINKAMETFTNEDFGGIVPSVTYTKTNHEASFRGRIVQVREDGSFKPLTDFYTPGKEKIRHLK
jgi:branched-chain amino acid transport system substrate-binding protein